MIIRRFRTIFLIVWSIATIIGITVGVITYFQRTWSVFDRNTRVNDLSVCQDENSMPRITTHYVEVCGYIITDYPPVVLTIVLYKMPEKELIDINPPSDEFDAGYFSRQLKLSQPNRQGRYRIDIYRGRERLVSTEFDVVEK